MQFTVHQQKVGHFLVEIHMKAGLITSLDGVGDRLPNWGRTRMCVCVCVCPLNIYAYTNINSTMIRIISYLFRQNRMLISLDSDKNCTKKSNHGDWHPGFFTPCHLHFVTKFRKKWETHHLHWPSDSFFIFGIFQTFHRSRSNLHQAGLTIFATSTAGCGCCQHQAKMPNGDSEHR